MTFGGSKHKTHHYCDLCITDHEMKWLWTLEGCDTFYFFPEYVIITQWTALGVVTMKVNCMFTYMLLNINGFMICVSQCFENDFNSGNFEVQFTTFVF